MPDERLPWFPFETVAWRGDLNLRSCSAEARAVWFEMLTVMHEAEPRGYFLLHGLPLEDAQRELEAEMGPREDQDYIETDEIGEAAGMPHLVAWKLVALNDIEIDTVWEVAHGPVQRGYGSYKGGIALVRDVTPEERYERVLAFVRSKLKQDATA